MTLIDRFIQDNYENLQEAARTISGNDPLWEDLLHYTIDEFLRKKDVEAIIESGGGRFYCVRIMMTAFRSSTSPFYHTYRKTNNTLTDIPETYDVEDETEYLTEKVKAELQKLSWYDRMLFTTFAEEGHTISSLARATGIPRTSISLSINRIRKHLKSIL